MLRYVCRFVAQYTRTHSFACVSARVSLLLSFVYFSFVALARTLSFAKCERVCTHSAIQLIFEWANTLMVGVYVSMLRAPMCECTHTSERQTPVSICSVLCECVRLRRERIVFVSVRRALSLFNAFVRSVCLCHGSNSQLSSFDVSKTV